MNTPLKIFIVEDEYLNRIHLKNTLVKLGYSVVAEAGTAEEAFDLLNKIEVDLIILDINLGEEEKDGIWIGNYINEHYDLPFIYLTAYGTSAIIKKAIETSPYAYLIKPFNEIELSTSVELAINNFNSKKEYLTLGNKKKITKIDINQIYYLESDKNYINIVTKNNTYRERTTIQIIKDKLPENKFLQIHRSFIININKIDNISPAFVTIFDKKIPATKNIQQMINLYK